MATLPVPLEEEEQANFVEWLELRGFKKFTAIPNSTFSGAYTGGVKKKNFSVFAKLHRQGLRKGFPDMFVGIPASMSSNGKTCGLFVEMKRLKGSEIKPEQQEWIDFLCLIDGIDSRICKGCQEAIRFVEEYLK